MSEQKKREITEIVQGISGAETENLEGVKNYLAGFVAGIKAARDEKKAEPVQDERKESDDGESREG